MRTRIDKMCAFTYLLCRILESKSTYFIKHPVVEEEVDSTAESRFLSWHILDAKTVLGVQVIRPKRIINDHHPLTCALIHVWNLFKCSHILEMVLVTNEKEDWLQMSREALTAHCQKILIHLVHCTYLHIPQKTRFMALTAITPAMNRTLSFKHCTWRMACTDLDQA